VVTMSTTGLTRAIPLSPQHASAITYQYPGYPTDDSNTAGASGGGSTGTDRAALMGSIVATLVVCAVGLAA
jgi:hypothetical protein